MKGVFDNIVIKCEAKITYKTGDNFLYYFLRIYMFIFVSNHCY